MVTMTAVAGVDLSARALSGKHLMAFIASAQAAVLLLLVLVTPGSTIAHILVASAALGVMLSNGALKVRATLSALDRAPQVFAAFAGATGALGALFAVTGLESAAMDVLRFGALGLAVSWTTLAWTSILGSIARHRGLCRDRVVVLGSGRVADRLNDALGNNLGYGLDVVGHVGPDLDELRGQTSRLGVPENLLAICQTHRANVVIVAYSQTPESALLEPIRECSANKLEVLVVPRFFEDLDHGQASDGVWGVPLQRLPVPTAGMLRRGVKRALDVLFASLALVVLLPVLTLCAIAISRETRAGILFRQMRVGQDERPIEMLKFQTMKPATRAEADTLWSIGNDDRLGPVGRFMRRTSLDELPQLWNVIRGDMSLVGPRPERPHFVEQFKAEIPSYGARHRVPVGLTGWAQVNALRGDSSIEERARFDNAYAASWSPWEDAKVLLRTVPQVLKGGGN